MMSWHRRPSAVLTSAYLRQRQQQLHSQSSRQQGSNNAAGMLPVHSKQCTALWHRFARHQTAGQ